MHALIRKLRKSIGYDLLWGIILLIYTLIRRLNIKASRVLAQITGTILYTADIKGQRRAAQQMLSAYPDWSTSEARRVCKKMYIHLCTAVVDWINADKLVADFDRYFKIDNENLNNLKNSIDENQGTIFITGHVGNWELLAIFLTQQGFPASGVARQLFDTRLTDLTLNLRQKFKINTVVRKSPQEGVLGLIRLLRKPGFTALIIDQDIKVPSVFVDFFGQLASTPKGAAELALKRKHKVVASFCLMQPDGSYRIYAEGPLELIKTGELENDIIANTALFTRLIEKYIRQDPSQWTWNHHRWKTRPPNNKLGS